MSLTGLTGKGRLDQYQTMTMMIRKITPAPATTCRDKHQHKVPLAGSKLFDDMIFSSCGRFSLRMLR